MSRTEKNKSKWWVDKVSEKKDKRNCNRKLRRKSKTKLKIDPLNYIEPNKEEILDVWDMAKDRH